MSKRGGGIVTAILGAILAIIGVILGLVPIQQVGSDCGSVFAGKSYGAFTLSDAYTDVVCQRAIGDRAAWVWGLIIVGLLAIIVGVVLAAQKAREIEPVAYRPSLSELKRERTEESAARNPGGRSIADELAALATLHDNGTLSDEEFDAAKHRALSRTDAPS